jgi:RNA polymerase sigma-70 factor, ECF subfamily
MSADSADITQLLGRSAGGDAAATAALLELTYDTLRQQAERQFRDEGAGHTLQPTAVVHESFMRLIGQRDIQWQNRAHFLSVAAMMMRRVLTDHARGKHRQKRGGAWRKLSELDDQQLSIARDDDVLMVHEALEKLEQVDPRQARIVELRFFGGLTNAEVAQTLGLSLRTIEAEWSFARAWLRKELDDGG